VLVCRVLPPVQTLRAPTTSIYAIYANAYLSPNRTRTQLLLFPLLHRTLLRIGTRAAMHLVPRLAVYARAGARAPNTFLDLLRLARVEVVQEQRAPFL